MADQSLEDFASGIGGGVYSPQQGSMLPPSAQGGVPLGAASPTPPRPVPPPSFQQAPLLQLGGQAPDLDQMIAELRKFAVTIQVSGDAEIGTAQKIVAALQAAGVA